MVATLLDEAGEEIVIGTDFILKVTAEVDGEQHSGSGGRGEVDAEALVFGIVLDACMGSVVLRVGLAFKRLH